MSGTTDDATGPAVSADDYSLAPEADRESVGEAVYLFAADVAHPFYRLLVDESDPAVRELDDALAAGGFSSPVGTYLPAAMTASVAAGVLATGAVVALAAAVGLPDLLAGVAPASLPGPVGLDTPAVRVAVVALAGAAVGFPLGGGGLYAAARRYPHYRAAARGRRIDRVLPDATAFLYALSVGGFDNLDIFAAMAAADDAYGPVAEEFQRIMRRVEYSDLGYAAAAEAVADTTRSAELAKLLRDMLSTVESGGDMTDFLETRKDEQIRQKRKARESEIDTLEILSEAFITVSLAPVLIIVVVVSMSLITSVRAELVGALVYLVLPLVDLAFLVVVATYGAGEVGDGRIDPESVPARVVTGRDRLFDVSTVARHARTGPRVFRAIRRREVLHRLQAAWADPGAVFEESPRRTAAVTVPVAAALVGGLAAAGAVDPTPAGLVAAPVETTAALVYLPAAVVGAPVWYFARRADATTERVRDALTADLRKLANANAAGETLLGAFEVAGGTGDPLSREFAAVAQKVRQGRTMNAALVELVNRHRLPRLARAVKLVQKAQESSTHIAPVLTAAAEISQVEDEMDAELEENMAMQTVIFAVTFLVFLVIFAIIRFGFVPTLAQFAGAGGGGTGGVGSVPGLAGGIDPGVLNVFIFHAVTIKAVLTGVVVGALGRGRLATAWGYILAFLAATLVVWAVGATVGGGLV